MKLQICSAAALLIAAATLGGCTGSEQFLSTSKDYVGDLDKLDPDYLKATDEIEQAAGDPEKQKYVRNMEIDRRLRVIDLNFTKIRKEFAGAQQAHSKAALYDQTLSALLAQMIASRKAVLVKIYEGSAQDIEVYSLSAAIKDLEAYEFAGSLPGAVIATLADAKVKNGQAEDKLAELRESTFGEDESGKKIQAFIRPPDGDASDPVNQANVKKLREWIDESPIAGLPIANFLNDPMLKALRECAIRDIPIP